MSANIKITGVPVTAGAGAAVPIRREIRDLQANFPDQWNLYILGLDTLQKASETDMQSYYQIAGIHGMPYKPWNGVSGIQNFPRDHGGYCTHSSVLFLPWHRPYLALFEQTLFAVVQKVASNFVPPDLKAKYVAAAKDFRMPYWDWATAISPAFPAVLTTTVIVVVQTDGTSKIIPNPLFCFKFHPMNPAAGDFSGYWAQFNTTLRYPDNSNQSHNEQVTAVVKNENASLRSDLSQILLSQTYKDFGAFSHNGWLQNGDAGQYGSLEDLHNKIHDTTGGGGHMGSLDVSAFDPIFFLHHCNVDRLWAIWQALNPNSYVTPQRSMDGNFTTQRNAVEDASTLLKPFWDASGTTFWNSTRVKSTVPFGYAYPETQSWNFPTAQAYQASLTSSVTRQYGGNVLDNFVSMIATPAVQPVAAVHAARKAVVHEVQQPLVAQTLKKAPVVTVVPADLSKDNILEAPPASSPTVPPVINAMLQEKKYTEWITNIRTTKHGLGQTYRVFVFLGDFNPDPATWPFEYNLVGRFTNLGRGDIAANCSKCVADAAEALTVTGTVSLTSALLQDIAAGVLSGLTSDAVVPHLKKNLHWRVTLFDGTERARDQVPGLKVGVCSTEVRIGDDGVPVYDGAYALHADITDGRPAGLNGGDQV